MHKLTLAFSLIAAIAAVGCGSSSSNNTGSTGSPSTYCSASIATTQVCYGYTNLTSQQQSSVDQSCKSSLNGKVVSSCPTDGIIGCCTTKSSYNTEVCYYQSSSDAGTMVDAGTMSNTYKQSCDSQGGTWSTSQ